MSEEGYINVIFACIAFIWFLILSAEAMKTTYIKD